METDFIGCDLREFVNEKFGKIRSLLKDGNPWFVASDLCHALNIKQATKALKRLRENEKGITTIATNGGPQKLNIVNELGMYRLTFSSRKPEAEIFQDWIYHEVLPQIRKSNIYTTPQIINQLFKSAEEAKFTPDLKCVYVFEMNNGTVKIGYTQNIKQRKQTIISSSGLDIVNCYFTKFIDSEIAYSIEQACHETFDFYRIRGEFFSIDFDEACTELDRQMDYIINLNQQGYSRQSL